MFVLERYNLNKKTGIGTWETYATYHDLSLLNKMIGTKKQPGNFRINKVCIETQIQSKSA